MNYKRLEIYTWWKCNHKCIFCIEYPNMEKAWNKEITKEYIMKKLLKYKNKWYNHVTFLWWEPFIHKVFPFAIRLAKKLNYTVLVTTNASTIQYENCAKNDLAYVDQLLISVPIINRDKQLEINWTKWIIDFEKVFKNIRKYWSWNFLKINTVINKLNLEEIWNILDFINKFDVKEISITYPDIIMPYYSKEHVKTKMAPSYTEVKTYIDLWFKKAEKYWINLVLADIPFCMLPDYKYIKNTDDYNYQTRVKVSHQEIEINREEYLPRRRIQTENCKKCVYNKTCWWPSRHYKEIYWLDEIKPIDKIFWDIWNKEFLKNQDKYLIM